MLSRFFSTRMYLRIILSILYAFTITVLSLMPSDDIPDLPLFPGADKAVHMLMYLGFSCLLCWTVIRKPLFRKISGIVVFAFLYGVCMEILQSVMQFGRSFDVFDMLANLTGAAIGGVLFSFLLRNKSDKSI